MSNQQKITAANLGISLQLLQKIVLAEMRGLMQGQLPLIARSASISPLNGTPCIMLQERFQEEFLTIIHWSPKAVDCSISMGWPSIHQWQGYVGHSNCPES